MTCIYICNGATDQRYNWDLGASLTENTTGVYDRLPDGEYPIYQLAFNADAFGTQNDLKDFKEEFDKLKGAVGDPKKSEDECVSAIKAFNEAIRGVVKKYRSCEAIQEIVAFIHFGGAGYTEYNARFKKLYHYMEELKLFCYAISKGGNGVNPNPSILMETYLTPPKDRDGILSLLTDLEKFQGCNVSRVKEMIMEMKIEHKESTSPTEPASPTGPDGETREKDKKIDVKWLVWDGNLPWRYPWGLIVFVGIMTMLSSACLWWMCFITSDICLRIVFCFAGLLPLFLFVVFVGCIGKSAKDVWVRILEMRVLLDFFNVACDGKDVKARLDCKQKLIEALTMVLTGRSGEY